MKYVPYPESCGVDLVVVNENEKKAILHISDLMKANRDSDPLPIMENKTIEISFTSTDDIYDAIEKNGFRRPSRLDPTK